MDPMSGNFETQIELELGTLRDKTEEESSADAAETSHKQQSPLLNLPGEVRNNIYKNLIAGHQIKMTMDKCYVYLDVPRELEILLQVCRHIRAEAGSYINKNVRFYVQYKHLQDMLSIMEDEDLNAISTLVIGFKEVLIRDIYKASRIVAAQMQRLCTEGSLRLVLIDYSPGKEWLDVPRLDRDAFAAYLGYLLTRGKDVREVKVVCTAS